MVSPVIMAGCASLGLCWGWLLVLRLRAGRFARNGALVGAASALAAMEVGAVAAWPGAALFVVGVAIAATVHAVWLRQLRLDRIRSTR